MGKVRPGIKVIKDIIDNYVDQKVHIIYNDVHYTLPKHNSSPILFSYGCNTNVIGDEILFNSTFYYKETVYKPKYKRYLTMIDNILFDTETLNVKRYKIHIKSKFCCHYHRMYLLNRKQYLLFCYHDENYRSFIRLIKIPDMLGFVVDGYHEVFNTPIFIIMFGYKTKKFLILDSNDDSIWFRNFMSKRRFEALYDSVKRSFKRFGITCDIHYNEILNTDEQIRMKKLEDRTRLLDIRYYDYNNLHRSRKFKELTDLILQGKKKCDLNWRTMNKFYELEKISN